MIEEELMTKNHQQAAQGRRPEKSILPGPRAVPDADHRPGAAQGPSRCHSAGVLAAMGDYLKRNRRGPGRNWPETGPKPALRSAGVAQTSGDSDNIG